MIDKKIIANCKRKDEQAYRQCYELCAPYVYTIIKNYISNDDYRRDAMQEVFSQIFLSMDNYNEKKGQFKSWIAQITIYQCISLLRKRKKLNLFVPLEAEVENVNCEKLLDPLSKEDLDQLLLDMPAGYKTIFLMYIIDGYTHKEIGEMLSVSIGTSKSQLSRAISWIRKNISMETKKYIYG